MIEYKVAGYLRLSKEDNENMESNSIVNQRELIEQYINGKEDLELIEYYIDYGYSGTNFNRPGFEKILQDMKNKKINCIIVKDLSRFARNHIEADMYFENIFPALNIRFISVIENIDSFENPDSIDNLIVPFKNLLNDAYAKDISKKVKSALTAKRLNGEFIGTSATYGYLKNPKDKHKLIIDEEASKNVIKIFNDIIEGKTASESFLKCADCGSSFTLRKVKNYEYYHCTSYVRNGACTSHSIRKDKLVEIVLEELNKKIKRNKIDTLTRDILLKNIDSIIISENREVIVNFK